MKERSRGMPRRLKSSENGGPIQGIERNRKASSAVKGGKLCERSTNRKSAVQRLYDMCEEMFSPPGTLPSPEAIQRLRSFLDTIKPVDVGLSEVELEQGSCHGRLGPNVRKGRRPASEAGWAPPITYLHVYECDSFSMGIFCLPTSAVLPLHNHPGMTVLSKLLYGSMHVKSFDWVDSTEAQQNTGPSQSRLAKLKIDTDFTAPCETSILCPRTGGNIHSFTAVTSCAVLDVLAPPYSETDGRHCSYYREYPYFSLTENGNTQSDDNRGYTWLEEIERPDDFFVRGGAYSGPKIEAR